MQQTIARMATILAGKLRLTYDLHYLQHGLLFSSGLGTYFSESLDAGLYNRWSSLTGYDHTASMSEPP